MADILKSCPFCGSPADPEGWSSTDRKGPACENPKCNGAADSVEAWNARVVTDEMVLRAAKAMWKASVPPGEENNFPDHPCIAQNLYLRAAYAGVHAALNP